MSSSPSRQKSPTTTRCSNSRVHQHPNSNSRPLWAAVVASCQIRLARTPIKKRAPKRGPASFQGGIREPTLRSKSQQGGDKKHGGRCDRKDNIFQNHVQDPLRVAGKATPGTYHLACRGRTITAQLFLPSRHPKHGGTYLQALELILSQTKTLRDPALSGQDVHPDGDQVANGTSVCLRQSACH